MRTAWVVLFALLVAPSLAWGEGGAVRPVRIFELPPVPKAGSGGVGARFSSAGPDSFQVITQTLAFLDIPPLFGDSNHDGSPELSGHVNSSSGISYRILEYSKEDGGFHEAFTGTYMDPYAVGDIDHDGKSDVIGQYGFQLFMYESLSPTEYPATLVWQSPFMTNTIGYDAVGDTDRDGNLEIIHSRNSGSSRLVIFENTGDNAFALKLNVLTSGQQETGTKVIADFDQDGLQEIAFCGGRGYVHVFESPTNDVWQETFTESTGNFNAYAATGGFDTDGNGKPELFVAGNLGTIVYESNGNNSFVRVARFGPLAIANCVANTDGVGYPEYVCVIDRHLQVYKAVAPGQWILSDVITDNGSHTLLTSFDVNKNGRDELYWVPQVNVPFENTLVLERPATSPTDSPWRPLQSFVATVQPTPCRAQATLRLPSSTTLGRVSALSVFDVGGRLVLRQNIAPGAGGAIGLPVHSLRAGCYVVRVESATGRMIATARTVVVR